MSLVVEKNIREYSKEAGLRCAEDVSAALHKKVQLLLDQAFERSKANGRVTLRSCDL